MGKVVFNTSVSLDGFVAGPNDSPDNGLGDGGEGLHASRFLRLVLHRVPVAGGRRGLGERGHEAELFQFCHALLADGVVAGVVHALVRGD